MGQGFESLKTHHKILVDVVQLVERQIVILVVVGSNPIVHPINIGISPSGKAPHFDCGIRRFKSCYPCQYAPLAQSVEHMTFNHVVRSSILRWGTNKYAGVAELADALDLGSSAFGVQVQLLSPAPFINYIK